MVRALLLVGVLSCHKTAPAPTTVSNAAQEAPVDAAPEVTACERHQALDKRAHECAALSDEIRQEIDQRNIDRMASVSESGMDGSTPVDPEALCEEEIEFLLRVAGTPCDLH